MFKVVKKKEENALLSPSQLFIDTYTVSEGISV